MQYRKVCQDVNISLNLCYKPTFYDMRFTRYTIVAKPYLTFTVSLKSCSGHPHACSRIFSQRVYLCLSYAKSFSYSKNLKSISIFSLHYFMSLANFNFSISHLKKTLSCSFKYFKSSDVIVVKKKSLSEVY